MHINPKTRAWPVAAVVLAYACAMSARPTPQTASLGKGHERNARKRAKPSEDPTTDPLLQEKIDDLGKWLVSKEFPQHCNDIFNDPTAGDRSILKEDKRRISPPDLSRLSQEVLPDQTRRWRLYYGGDRARPEFRGAENPRGKVPMARLGYKEFPETFHDYLLEKKGAKAVLKDQEKATQKGPENNARTDPASWPVPDGFIAFTVLSDNWFTSKKGDMKKERASLLHELLHVYLMEYIIDAERKTTQNGNDDDVLLRLIFGITQPKGRSDTIDISDFFEKGCS